ncbi:serine/threonine-protein kinase, partial [Streptomyces longispororuber]|uniref:serine/threonine-protein kinase n=1 Tax=Streptomyces longispororuber TaxID=68230 RepID=UPI00210D0995
GVFQPLQPDDPTVVAGYRLAARLGAGGMGRVYLSHTQGGRPVAIKVVRPELADDPDFRRRFRREMEAARRVRGAYTAELIDGDAGGAPPWLATLYVPGPSLAEAVGRRGPLPVPAVLWLMAGVAEALAGIHGAGIVHRDLKPSNVLLASDGPRVIDFGISLASGISSHTATGASIGTPQFMAPEQAAAGAAGEITAATDVFALGQTAAFAALGRPLYGDGPAVSVLYRIVHDEPDLSPLPEQLRPLIARCLATDPRERATPAEVVEWCRRELGRDADAGAGPAVWQEVTGPEVTVPPPVATPVAAPPTQAYATQPLSPWRAPETTRPSWPDPDQLRARRRRHGLIGVAGVTVGVLMLGGLGYSLWNALGGIGERGNTGASQSSGASSGSAGSSASSGSSGSDSTKTSKDGSTDTTGSAGGSGDTGSSGSTSGSGTPRASAFPMQWLDEKNSLTLKNGTARKDRKGDIRFTCAKEISCALEGDKVLIAPAWERVGTPFDNCSAYLAGTGADKRMPLAAITTGSEICFKQPDGTIGLFVVETKSTALPKSGSNFLTGNLTVWRAE